MSLSDDLKKAKDMPKSKKEKLGRLAELLERSGIDVDDAIRVEKLRVWQGFMRGDDGDPQTVDMASVVLSPAWEKDGPDWPVVQPADPVTIKSKALKRDRPDDLKVAVVLPDPQIGYRQDIDTGDLDPFHDEHAMDLALQITRQVRPDRIINLGDFLDLPSMSKFIQEPAFAHTTQAAINRGHSFLAEQRACAPDAEIDLLEGNHDARASKSIMANAASAFGLRKANMPNSWPVLSVPNLLRVDDLDVNYHAGYPANELWLNDNLRCIHGLKVRSASSTAKAVVDDERVNVIFGHVHRQELMYRTVHTRQGARSTFAATPGCLSRIDGAVPSTKSGADLLGRPLQSFENWQAGIGIVHYENSGSVFGIELIAFFGTKTIWRGQMFQSEFDSNGETKA